MRLSNAIRLADMMRPNNVPEPEKKMWLMQLESEFAEMLRQEAPDLTVLDDPELILPEPWSVVYHLYLAGYIDHWQEEMELWQADTIVANQAIAEAKAWLRRQDNPSRIIPEEKDEEGTVITPEKRPADFKGVWI